MTTCSIATVTVKYKIKNDSIKKKIATLLNELFMSDDQQQNEATVDRYANEYNITVT